jgi:hypothetical protein
MRVDTALGSPAGSLRPRLDVLAVGPARHVLVAGIGGFPDGFGVDTACFVLGPLDECVSSEPLAGLP